MSSFQGVGLEGSTVSSFQGVGLEGSTTLLSNCIMGSFSESLVISLSFLSSFSCFTKIKEVS